MAPAGGLDIHLYDDSLNCIQPSEIELCRGAIMKDALGIQADRRCAQRKLNNVGYLAGHCAHVNSEENMETMRHNLMFVSTQAEINRKEAADKATKRKEVAGALEEKAPDAAKKLELNRLNISSVTVDEIKGFLFKVYNKSVPGIQSKLRKPDYVKVLEKQFRENIGRYEGYIATLELGAVDVNNGAIVDELGADDANNGAVVDDNRNTKEAAL